MLHDAGLHEQVKNHKITSWNPCRRCQAPSSDDPAETLIAWGADTEIRPGDMVLLDPQPNAFCLATCLPAQGCSGQIRLQPPCGMPPLFVRPGDTSAANGFIQADITGIVRGTYLVL
jgi:hypothetical protein